MGNQLVKFEQEPNNAKILDNIFRLVHTIKGTCGFLGLPRLEALAHAGETLMGKFRDGMPVTGEAVIAHLQANAATAKRVLAAVLLGVARAIGDRWPQVAARDLGVLRLDDRPAGCFAPSDERQLGLGDGVEPPRLMSCRPMPQFRVPPPCTQREPRYQLSPTSGITTARNTTNAYVASGGGPPPSGSTVLPLDLDIFPPSAARTRPGR